MKYKLNELSLKTTNNFKVNNIEVDLEIPTNYSFHDYIINKKDYIKEEVLDNKINSRIGLSYDTYKKLSINITKNEIIKEPILVEYNFNNNDSLIDNINIEFEENSKADIIIKYRSLDNNNHYHQLIEKVISKENSQGSITIINQLNDNSINLVSIENSTEENSNITHNIIDLSGKKRLYNILSNTNGYNSINTINNIYIGNNDEIIDINYYLKNNNKNTNNYLNVEGVLNNKSKKIFRGTIDFIEGSSNSIGKEKENCILLSDDCISRSLPVLLCHEENVVGEHGVSSGKISKEKLFYLMTKGLSQKEAEKLIINTNFNKIISKINDKETIEEIQRKINNKIK